MWLELARDARKSANELVELDHFRSCISRAYYAAYSKVAHELVVTAGLSMPPDREGPNHPGRLGTGGIRRLIETSMPNMQEDKRVKLSELVGRLYTLRIDADYKPSVTVEGRDAREAISIMKTIFDSFYNKIGWPPMPTVQQIDPIVQKIEQQLKAAEARGIHLKVSDSKLDDDWLYVVVVPKQAGVRASDHAQLMSEIERNLRADGDERVLLVPALDD